MAELENEILMNGDLKSKLKQDNTQLVHRYSQKTIIILQLINKHITEKVTLSSLIILYQK